MKLLTLRAFAACTIWTMAALALSSSRAEASAPVAAHSILQPTVTRSRPIEIGPSPSSRALCRFIQKPLPAWAHEKEIGRVHLKPHTRVVALTFDDGPWPVYTEKILAILKREHVHATFFMIGRNVAAHPELARRVVAEGHAIGNHTWNHPSRPRGAGAEITRTDAALKQAVGFTPNLFRPPYGMLHNGLATFAKQQGKAVLIWSSDSRDWDHASAGSIYATVMRQSGPGGIILMHDGGGNRAATAAALPDVIASLRARGYKFATIPELLAMRTASRPPSNHRTVKKPLQAHTGAKRGPSKGGTAKIAAGNSPAANGIKAAPATAPAYSSPKPAATPARSKPGTSHRLPAPATGAKARQPLATVPKSVQARSLAPRKAAPHTTSQQAMPR